MNKIILEHLKILFPSFLAILISTLFWNKISFEYKNPYEIIGYYSIFEYSALNDNIRYILFVGIPILTYLLSYIFFKRISFKTIKDFLVLTQNYPKSENVSVFFLYSIILIISTFFLASEFNKNLIDLFHEGQALSGALNFKLKNELWSSSFVVTSLFVDILNANISWFLMNEQSISSYRLYIEILDTLTLFIIIIFFFNLINNLDLSKNLKTFFLIFFCFFIFYYVDQVAFGYRELPVFLFLYFVHEIFVKKNYRSFYCFILGLLPLLSLLWSLDRGVFVVITYIPFLMILFFNQKFYEILIIIVTNVFTIIFFYYLVGPIEFNNFIINSLDILVGSDLLNGLIHPTPFTNEYGSARATKNLLLIIINGILIINYFFKKKTNLTRSSILFVFVFYFLSIIFYKIGVTRSDGGHIKQGASLNAILFLYLIIYNILFFINQKKFFFKSKLNYFNLFLCLIFFIINAPDNYLRNIIDTKDRIINYINIPDENFLTKEEIFLVNELRILTKNQNCFQLFSYETAISYYLGKTTCTKFYHIMNMGLKKNQLKFIDELKKSKPKFILTGGNYENIGNMKGRDNNELSSKKRFTYIDNYISNNYKPYKIFKNWNILIKNN